MQNELRNRAEFAAILAWNECDWLRAYFLLSGMLSVLDYGELWGDIHLLSQIAIRHSANEV